jgi:hypothetical protein
VVAFVTSLIVLFGLTALVFPVAKRRPIGTPTTWGEAMVAATFTFFLMFWAYGVVPHLWLSWADNELKWRPDALLANFTMWGTTPFGVLNPVAFGGSFPMTISMQTIRDIFAVLIYVVFLGLNMYLFTWWQKRGTKAPTSDVVTSDYGRPLVKKA